MAPGNDRGMISRSGFGFHGLALAGSIPECCQKVSIASRFI
jgi:hypothetical protein